MKPGKYDRKHPFLIAGAELRELKRHTEDLPQSFGLHHRLQRYQGTRPIALYLLGSGISPGRFCRWCWTTETGTLQQSKSYSALKAVHDRFNKHMTLPTGKVSAV